MKHLQVDDNFYEKIKSYAVFIPIIKVDGKDHILFQVRSHIVSQAGEVSFPGGSVEEGEDFKMAAIRELKEELLLEDDEIEYLGYSSMIFNSSYRYVKSFYGRINKKLDQIKYNDEVESIFAVDIDYFKNNPPKIYKAKYKIDFPEDFPFEKIPNGKNYKFWTGYNKFYFYDTDPVIWGMTARMLKVFIESWIKDEK